MSSSRAVPGSVTMPWESEVTPAAPLAHTASPPHIRPQEPDHLTSRLLGISAYMHAGDTCGRLSIALSMPSQLGQRRGDDGDGCQHNGVETNVIGMIGTEARLRVQTAAMKVQWCVSPIDVLPTSCQPFPVIIIFLSTSISSTRQTRRSSRTRTYLSLASNASSRSSMASQGMASLSTSRS